MFNNRLKILNVFIASFLLSMSFVAQAFSQDLDKQKEDDLSRLQLAIVWNQVDVIKKMIADGVDINYGGLSNTSCPIFLAVELNRTEILKAFIDSTKI